MRYAAQRTKKKKQYLYIKIDKCVQQCVHNFIMFKMAQFAALNWNSVMNTIKFNAFSNHSNGIQIFLKQLTFKKFLNTSFKIRIFQSVQELLFDA